MMETAAQSYWHTEYQWSKNWYCNTKSNRIYENFAKQQYHKARRQYDKELIEQELNRIQGHQGKTTEDMNHIDICTQRVESIDIKTREK